MSTLPDVSVIVISYNDAERLSRAIRSVQRQTLRNLEILVVDDASTDDTEQVVAELAAHDPRIIYVRLSENSGGCSAPRNEGMRRARGAWVMFCDSDDEYERHACKNLLTAAERLEADVVCGMAERIDVSTGKAKAWRPEVHSGERVAEGLVGFPELLYDTISVNKIYRAAHLQRHGLEFPEGLLFEDQLFTLEAMALADRVAVIPEIVYRWYVDRLTEDLSITQRRAEMRNIESRMEINRRIDAFLQRHGFTSLKQAKDIKFLRHDLHLYLSSILDVDDEVGLRMMEALVGYVREVDLRAAWQIRPLSRVAIYHLLLGDLEHVRKAMIFLRWASVVAVPVRDVDGRQLWCCGHEVSGPEVEGIDPVEWLDVTSLDLVRVPFVERRYLHQVTEVSSEANAVVITGTTFDYLEDVDLSSCDAWLSITTDKSVEIGRMPIEWTGRDQGHLTWRARGPVQAVDARMLREGDRGAVAMRVRLGELTNTTVVRGHIESAQILQVPYSGTTEPTGVDALRFDQLDRAAVGWRATRSPAHERARAHASRRERLRFVTWLTRGFHALVNHMVHPIALKVGRWMPRSSVVLIELSGDPSMRTRRILDTLMSTDPSLEVVWVTRDGSSRGIPDARAVVAGQWRHAWLRSRACLTLDDTSAGEIASRPGIIVHVGSGPHVTREGLDDPSVLASTGGARDARARGKSWNLALASGPADAKAMRSAWKFAGAMAEIGTPEIEVGAESAMKAALGLPADRPVVVYCPAPRGKGAQQRLMDFDDWNTALGHESYLVVCTSDDVEVPTRLRSAVRLVTSDPAPFAAAADIVISDYGHGVSWAIAADKRLLLFQPDQAQYVLREHGLYTDVEHLAPVSSAQGELHLQVRDILAGDRQERFAQARADFAAEWCGGSRGRVAAQQAADAILTTSGRGGHR